MSFSLSAETTSSQPTTQPQGADCESGVDHVELRTAEGTSPTSPLEEASGASCLQMHSPDGRCLFCHPEPSRLSAPGLALTEGRGGTAAHANRASCLKSWPCRWCREEALLPGPLLTLSLILLVAWFYLVQPPSVAHGSLTGESSRVSVENADSESLSVRPISVFF